MSIHAILRQRLLIRAGLLKPENPMDKLARLERSEWSPRFERLMRNRLIMASLRYGPMGTRADYDRVTAIKSRLKKYEETGNLEHLVDIANFALSEFEEGKHPKKHWESIDDGEHATKTNP